MTMSSTTQQAIRLDVTGHKRDWFLRDSRWEDPLWVFAPTNVLEEREPARIRWDFILPSTQRFTDPAYAYLLETTRQLIALIRTRSLFTGRPHRSRTAFGYFVRLRPLLRWMDQEGIRCFADLDRAALRQYEHALRERHGRGGERIRRNTVRDHLKVLVYLYHFRDELGDGLPAEPFPGERAGVESDVRFGRYTPDTLAVPRVQKSIEFLEAGAIDILRAREI